MTTLSSSIAELRTMIDQTEAEIKSLEGGKKASSIRARKGLQSIKTSSHALRKRITQHTKSLPTKSKAKKEPEPVAEPVPEPQKTKPKRVRKKKSEIVEE